VVTIDQTNYGPLLHVSLAYQKRDPTLRDVQLVRDAFFPVAANVMMQLPAAQDKLHQHCFHLHQVPDIWSVKQDSAAPPLN
jgi:hypothetical protein